MGQLSSHDRTYLITPEHGICDGNIADAVVALRTAVLHTSNDTCDGALRAARAAYLTNSQFADICIPQVARDLGQMWCDDLISFAEVTIGTARLQSLLRQISVGWHSDVSCRRDEKTVLVIVPPQAQHTLGPAILVSQLRRRGVSVRILVGATPAQVSTNLRRSPVDAVFMSLTCLEMLDSLRSIVNQVRKGHIYTPVVIGGPAISLTTVVCATTGADHATSDLDEALTLCGLIGIRPPAIPPESKI